MSNSTKIYKINLGKEAQVIFEKAKLNEEIVNKEMGLFLPPDLEEKYLEIWEEYFTLLRIMYADGQLLKDGVNFYLKTFFEIPNENKKFFVNDMTDAVFKKIEENQTINEVMAIDEMKRQAIVQFDSLQTDQEKIEFLTYLNNGKIPSEVQALIDERDAENEESQLSPEEVDELQRNAISNIFSKYNSNHGALNLGKNGSVVSAEAIEEFINQKEDEEAQNLRATTKIRTMPKLPNSNENSTPNFGQNQSQNLIPQNSPNSSIPQNNIANSNFTNPQNPNLSNFNNSQNNSNFVPQFAPNNSVQNIQHQNKNQQSPKSNIASFGSNPNSNSQNSPIYSNNNSNLHNPKAIPPRTRGLNDLLKK